MIIPEPCIRYQDTCQCCGAPASQAIEPIGVCACWPCADAIMRHCFETGDHRSITGEILLYRRPIASSTDMDVEMLRRISRPIHP